MRASIENNGAAFALAGWFNSTPAYLGSNGDYWSSTRYNNTYMYRIYLSTSNVNPAYGGSRRSGYAIRCVLK